MTIDHVSTARAGRRRPARERSARPELLPAAQRQPRDAGQQEPGGGHRGGRRPSRRGSLGGVARPGTGGATGAPTRQDPHRGAQRLDRPLRRQPDRGDGRTTDPGEPHGEDGEPGRLARTTQTRFVAQRRGRTVAGWSLRSPRARPRCPNRRSPTGPPGRSPAPRSAAGSRYRRRRPSNPPGPGTRSGRAARWSAGRWGPAAAAAPPVRPGPLPARAPATRPARCSRTAPYWPRTAVPRSPAPPSPARPQPRLRRRPTPDRFSSPMSSTTRLGHDEW